MALLSMSLVLAVLTPADSFSAQVALFQAQKTQCQSELNVDTFDDATQARNQSRVEALQALLASILPKPKIASDQQTDIFPMTCLPEMGLENLDGYLIRDSTRRIFLSHTRLLSSDQMAQIAAGDALWSVGSDAASERYVQLERAQGRTINLLLIAQDGPFPPNSIQLTKTKGPYLFTAWEAFEPAELPQCKPLFEHIQAQTTLLSQELKDCYEKHLSKADRTRALAQAKALELRIDALSESMSSK